MFSNQSSPPLGVKTVPASPPSMTTAPLSGFAQQPKHLRRPSHDEAPPPAKRLRSSPARQSSKPAGPRPSTKIRLAQNCSTGSRPARQSRAARTRYGLRPRAHARHHRVDQLPAGDDPQVVAVTIPSQSDLDEWFRGSTPHRYAARHRTPIGLSTPATPYR